MNNQSDHYATFDSTSRKWLLVLLFIISIPAVASFFTDHQERSKWEKRELAKLPTLKSAEETSQYFSDMDLYINDHIGFALNLNKIYRQIVYYVFRESPVDNISYGKNGFTYVNSHPPQPINSSLKALCGEGRKFDRVANIEKNLDTIYQHFEQRGYPVSFGIAVSKVALYPDNLPENISSKLLLSCEKYSEKDNILTQLHDQSTDESIFHYPQKELLALKNEPYFYPKENFHWNGMSAHYFSKGLLSRMGIKMDEASYDKKYLKEVNADMRQLGFVRKATVWHYPYKDYQVKKNRESLELIRQYYENVRDYSEFNTNNPATDETALVLSNSFGTYTVPHLAPAFRKLYNINIHYIQDKDNAHIYGELVDRLDPDRIIFIFHDQNIILSPKIDKIVRYANTKK